MTRYIVMATRNGVDYRASQPFTSHTHALGCMAMQELMDTDHEYTWRIQVI